METKNNEKNCDERSAKQPEKARLGAIGENLVVVKLMEQGWDAFNANCSIKNYKSIDIICLNSDAIESHEKEWKPATSLIQVKTSYGNNIPVGFTLNEACDKDFLWKMVKGPYVFVYVSKDKITNKNTYRYFILSRSMVVELIYIAHNYYVNVFHKNEKLVMSAPAGFNISWLEGKPEFSPKNKTHFGNPIMKSCENEWKNIWEE